MKKFTKEIKIALVVIAGLIILFFGMNYLKGLDIFSSSNKYFISFKIPNFILVLLYINILKLYI